jgi:nucleoside-diphosphate-sugar epimerase
MAAEGAGKRALITGLSGFTGHYVAQELRNAGYEVFGTITPGHAPGAGEFAVDLNDRAGLAAVVQQVQPDVVAHLAAIAFVAHGDAEQIYRVNVVGTRNLLEALAGLAHKPSAVLLASSANIYGNADVGVIDEQVPAPGQRLRCQQAVHGIHGAAVAGQAAADRRPSFQLHRRGPAREFPAAENRLALPPPGRRHRAGQPARVARLFRRAHGGASYRKLLAAPAAIGSTFNICSGHGYSLGEALDMMADIAGYKINVHVNPPSCAPMKWCAWWVTTAPGWRHRRPGYRAAGRHAALDVHGVSTPPCAPACRYHGRTGADRRPPGRPGRLQPRLAGAPAARRCGVLPLSFAPHGDAQGLKAARCRCPSRWRRWAI